MAYVLKCIGKKKPEEIPGFLEKISNHSNVHIKIVKDVGGEPKEIEEGELTEIEEGELKEIEQGELKEIEEGELTGIEEPHRIGLVIILDNYYKHAKTDTNICRADVYQFAVLTDTRQGLPVIEIGDDPPLDFRYKTKIREHLETEWEIKRKNVDSIHLVSTQNTLHIYVCHLRSYGGSIKIPIDLQCRRDICIPCWRPFYIPCPLQEVFMNASTIFQFHHGRQCIPFSLPELILVSQEYSRSKTLIRHSAEVSPLEHDMLDPLHIQINA